MKMVKPENVGMSSLRLGRIVPTLQRYVDEQKLAGFVTLAARRGQIVLFEPVGYANLETRKVMQPDTIFRIYSMTKPITSVAVMILLEEGRLHINTPVSEFAPWFKDCLVLVENDGEMRLEPMRTEINIRHLLTHSAGLSYGFMDNHYIDSLYREKVWKLKDNNPDLPFEELLQAIASIPLVFQPAAGWRYSMATDVLGYVVQQASGKPFDAFLKERIFEPLGMKDTGFSVPPEKVARFAVNYAPLENGGLKVVDDPVTSVYLKTPVAPSGGGGLVSTASDYLAFCQMLLNKGELDGVRLLGRKTVEWMTTNHLPNDGRIDDLTQGFGLGFSILLEPGLHPMLGSRGMYRWGGAANTKFWIDPQEQLIGILMLQCMPSDKYPVEQDFQDLVYQSLVD